VAHPSRLALKKDEHLRMTAVFVADARMRQPACGLSVVAIRPETIMR
jgi:hypothetical protein